MTFEGDITASSSRDGDLPHSSFSCFILPFLHLEFYLQPIFSQLPRRPSEITLNSVLFSLLMQTLQYYCSDIFTAHTPNTQVDSVAFTESISQVIFMLITQPLLRLLPSSLLTNRHTHLAAHSEKLWLSLSFQVPLGDTRTALFILNSWEEIHPATQSGAYLMQWTIDHLLPSQWINSLLAEWRIIHLVT